MLGHLYSELQGGLGRHTLLQDGVVSGLLQQPTPGDDGVLVGLVEGVLVGVSVCEELTQAFEEGAGIISTVGGTEE